MHAFLYNEAVFQLTLRPRSPLLIKAGSSGEDALDPTLPDMSFVRMRRPGHSEDQVFIPGSSMRGVVRSHAEKLLRSIDKALACDPTRHQGDRVACFSNKPNTSDISGVDAYTESCRACRIFGNTALAGRARVSDLYITDERDPLLSRRYGVAIDRITGAVAQGPFEIEILTDARFSGQITLRNYTLGQLGLVAAALLDVHDGLVPMGYGKSRGLGRVEFAFDSVALRTLRAPGGAILGVGALADADTRTAYGLPTTEADRLDVGGESQRQRGFHVLETRWDGAVQWLEGLSGRWVEEVIR